MADQVPDGGAEHEVLQQGEFGQRGGQRAAKAFRRDLAALALMSFSWCLIKIGNAPAKSWDCQTGRNLNARGPLHLLLTGAVPNPPRMDHALLFHKAGCLLRTATVASDCSPFSF